MKGLLLVVLMSLSLTAAFAQNNGSRKKNRVSYMTKDRGKREENKFLETDNKTLHTRERCESLKETSKSVPNNGNDLSVEVLLKRLDQLGISIDLSKLRLVK